MNEQPQSDPVAQGINDAVRGFLSNVNPVLIVSVFLIVAVTMGFFSPSRRH